MSLPRRRLLALSLALAAAPAAAQQAPVLTVSGTRLGPPGTAGHVDFELAQLRALPQQRIVTATPWYRSASEFAGPLLRDVLAAAGVKPDDNGSLRAIALNDYRVEIPLADARRFDVLLAHQLDGRPMAVREKGPLFVIYPFDSRPELKTTTYYNRCIWQLRTLELV